MPAPPKTDAIGAGAEHLLGGAAVAAPGPASAASAAITAMITAPRLPEVFLFISHSLSPQYELLGGLCGGAGRRASPVRGRGLRNSLVRVTSSDWGTPPKRGRYSSGARK
jgi:hypothetical protein